MAFLTIAGITVEAQTNAAQESEGTLVGERVRTFSGTLRSTVRARKRAWSFTTPPLTAADAATLRAAIALDAVVSCAGDALGGAVDCMVRVTQAPFQQDTRQASDFSVILQLELEEV